MLSRGLFRPLRAAAALLRARPQPTGQQNRKMSGLVEKNYYVEEWNGRREITEKTFKFDGNTVPSLLFLALLFPGFIYMVMRDELSKKYKKLHYNFEQM